MDLVVEGLVVVELKCVEEFSRVHQAQLLSYLKLSGINVGCSLASTLPTCETGLNALAMAEIGSDELRLPL
jgi:PD-(D/E)XK nuclease superfamily